MLYQAFADGHTATHHLTAFMPEPLRTMQKRSTLDTRTTAEI
jgi:hypothetical protein